MNNRSRCECQTGNVRWEADLEITPVPQGRPRVTRRGITYLPARSVAFRNEFRAAIAEKCPKMPLSCPVTAEITFRLPMPARLSKRKRAALSGAPHAKRPDLDNLVKAVLDALNGHVISDDGLIATISASKIWCEMGGISIRLIDADVTRKEDN